MSTCYFNEQMEYCPILLKIRDEVLIKEYGCEYLLQVWSTEGQMVYEKPLKSKDTSVLKVLINR